MTRPRFIGGALIAAAAAGPLSVTLPLAWLLVTEPHRLFREWAFSLLLPLVALPVGFVVALLPSVACAALLAHAGRTSAVARHPLAWAAVGALLGASFGLLVFWPITPGTAGFAIAGALCALLARWRTRWN